MQLSISREGRIGNVTLGAIDRDGQAEGTGEAVAAGGALQEELDAFLAFASGGVLLWHDPDGAFEGALGGLSLPDDVTLVREGTSSRFELLCRVNDLAADETLLLYRARRHRVERSDWLADVEAYADCFSPEAEPPVARAAVEEPAERRQEPAATAPAPGVELDQDWYSLAAFRAALGITDEDALLAEASARGYALFPDCALRRTWGSPAAYYRTLLAPALVSYDSLPTALRAAPSFATFLAGAMAAGEVLEYDDETWITTAGLAELEITSGDLDAFARQATERAIGSGIPQFTVPWLRANVTGVALMDYGLADCFYESALLSRRRSVSRGHLAGRRIFADSRAQARGRDLVESIVRAEVSLDLEDLLEILRNDYGISVQRAQIVALVRQTGLFYSPELGRVYRDHDQFVREVE